jgi:hypothetical protein
MDGFVPDGPGWDEIFYFLLHFLPISYACGTFLIKRNTPKQRRNVKFKQFPGRCRFRRGSK